jgi:asparagine synthase (glutamine-hydrolysing)
LDLSRKEALKKNWKAISFILWYELFFNENVDLLLHLQKMALRQQSKTDYGFKPAYLDNYPLIWPFPETLGEKVAS